MRKLMMWCVALTLLVACGTQKKVNEGNNQKPSDVTATAAALSESQRLDAIIGTQGAWTTMKTN
ncbi:MAG: hypothetical protein IJ775_06545, partial [Muribaculaceae bacterium]|nr:hypothetical protein [Muribaculaceae bacterium]